MANDNLIFYVVIGVVAFLFLTKFIYDSFLVSYCEEVADDGKKYKVQCGYKEADDAANLLSKLNTTAEYLIAHMKRKYGGKDNDAGFLTDNLAKRYRGYSRLVETDPDNKEGDTAYTLDKGYLVSMCLRCSRSKDEDKFHQLNTLIFVLIHELGHIAANVVQHPERYWVVFKFLLREAVEAKLYNPINYYNNPVPDYCTRLKIDYNPFYDSGLADVEGQRYI